MYETKYDEALGKCKFCDAPMVKSPKTGKVFCSEKCWLKKSDAMQNTTPKNEFEHLQDRRAESIRLQSSGRDATLIVVAMMGIRKDWTEDQLKSEIEKWQNYFFTKIYVDRAF